MTGATACGRNWRPAATPGTSMLPAMCWRRDFAERNKVKRLIEAQSRERLGPEAFAALEAALAKLAQ